MSGKGGASNGHANGNPHSNGSGHSHGNGYSKLNGGIDDGISRRDARVNVDLVMLEPMGGTEADGEECEGEMNGDKLLGEKKSKRPMLEEKLEWHQSLVKWRQNLEKELDKMGDQVGEQFENMETQTQKMAEAVNTAVDANLKTFLQFSDFLVRKVEKEEEYHDQVQKQLGLVEGPTVGAFLSVWWERDFRQTF